MNSGVRHEINKLFEVFQNSFPKILFFVGAMIVEHETRKPRLLECSTNIQN